MDEVYRMKVNVVSIKRYREDENFRKIKFDVVVKKYEFDDLFRLKRKMYSKNQYDCSLMKKV